MKTILDFILENKKQGQIAFRGAGHRGRADIFDQSGYGDFYHNMLAEDLTEISGADTLARPSGLIRSTMEYYADLYGVVASMLLVNGCGSGIHAAIQSCVPRGGKLILARNSNPAAFSALRMNNIKPVYMRPAWNEKYGIHGEITAAEVRMACEDNHDATAVLITSPNVFGIMSDISAIADVVHTYGMTLIVDQSHGAHLRFFDAVNNTSSAAEDLGADIVIDGTDETLLSLAGTGVMNVCTRRVDVEALESQLAVFNESGHSYLAIGGLDVNEKILRRYGGEIINSWMEDLRYAYHQLDAMSGVRVITAGNLDPTKINISLASVGVSGAELESELRKNNIYAQAVNGEYVLLSTAAGNRHEDYVTLVNTVKAMAENHGVGEVADRRTPLSPDFVLGYSNVPKECEAVPLYQADGRVLYDPIITYPPGAAIACPGEIMNIDVISYVAKALEREDVVIGVDDEGYIFVGKC